MEVRPTVVKGRSVRCGPACFLDILLRLCYTRLAGWGFGVTETMAKDFVIGIFAVAAFAVFILAWPEGRAIVRESLLHPLRRSVIERDANGRVTVSVLTNGKHPRWQDRERDEDDHHLEPALTGATSHRRIS
jgi:hypothetical protein